MPVRNPRKAASAAGAPWSGPKRKTFAGDIALLPMEEQEGPMPGSRKLKPSYEKPRRKSPKHILKGPQHRPPGIDRKNWVADYMLTNSKNGRWEPLTRHERRR